MVALLIVACTDSRSSSPSSTIEPAATTPPGRATTTSDVPPSGQVEVPHEVVEGFDDHTVSQIASVGEFHALARPGISAGSVVKFSIPTMDSSDDVRWMDSNFYSLHDEWFWFRLLNGRSVPGFDTQPVNGQRFRTVEDIYAWAGSRTAAELPLDLRFIDSSAYGRRLYSDDFYRLGFPGDVRNYGLGSLVYLPDAADQGEHWLIELEFSDTPSAEEVAHYFDLLMATLPGEIGNALEWVIRSPEQEAVAQEMAAAELRFHDRIVRYRELVPAGQVAVYNPGIAAGRLLLVDGVNTQLGDATENDIVLVEDVPDWLPPASALISSSPQTPLAHVNLLARNRGIPNASQAGLLDDAGLRQAARVRAHAIVRATPDGQLDVVLITADEYSTWRQLGRTTPISVPPVGMATMPTVVDLIQLSGSVGNEAEIDAWRPIIGGKSAGFLSLLTAPGVTTPQNPLAITVAPYLEHLDQVSGELDAMLADPDFRNSARVRFLLLEGPDDYADSYPEAADADLAAAVIAKHPIGTPLAAILDAGGFKNLFRDVDVNPATLARIVATLRATYGDYAETQGLRFRSSSSVEDIEGFTGAGLYDSNTGFLEPEAQPDEGDHKKTVERTIKKTWSSYWGFEAFEERRLENVDHRSGAMGVLVHARFDDELEVHNGVATFTLLPGNSSDLAVAMVNVQVGDESVTNPDPINDELPEVVELRLGADGSIRVERLAESTLADGAPVMTDEALLELFAQLESVAELWRRRTNLSLPVAHAIETVTLDFEFKTMAQGWPARPAGEPQEPGRLVVKQARSLDPGLRGLPDVVLELPLGRDLLARARSVVQVTCAVGDDSVVATVEVLTDPSLSPDLGYSEQPFVFEPEPGVADHTGCQRTTLFATPDHFLIELLQSGTVLEFG